MANTTLPNIRQMRICFIGDSFVNGVGDPACLGWAGRVCAAAQQQQGHDITYYNLGIRRDTSSDIAHRWRDEVTRRLPADADGRIIFSFGVNDTTIEDGTSPRVDAAASLANVRGILEAARQAYPTLFVGPPPIADAAQNQRIAALSHAYSAICADLDIPYLPVFEPLRATEIWIREVAAYDGAHPCAAGYAALADLVSVWPAWQAWFH